MSSERDWFSLFGTAPPEHNFEKWYGLREGDVYVEAGAFWGRYGKIASKKVGSTGKVILIEPSPENANTIEKVIDNFNLGNVTLVRKAVWSRKGITDWIIWGNPSSQRIAIESDKISYPNLIIQVEMDTIDNLLTDLKIDYVDLLACDVEGAELELVKSAEKYLNEKRILHVALAAYHVAEKTIQEILSILEEKDFKSLRYENGLIYGRM